MKYLPKNTLAHYNAAPQVHQHGCVAEYPTSVFSAATLKYRTNCGMVSPNDEAVTFYTLNHCASIVRKSFTPNEPLPSWAEQIMAHYTDATLSQGERLLHYILSITTREMRHLKSTTSATLWNKVQTQFSQKAVDYLKKISSNGSETVAVDTYMKQPPDLTIGNYTKSLAYAYHHGSWSGGYGGHPWGQVTDAVVAYLTGETSMEMLVDTAYTLAHNNGPIFNKGMMYSHYDSHFMTILDVQRSGQMLDLLVESNMQGVKKTTEASGAVTLIRLNKPEVFKGYVDWKLVDDLRPAKDKAANPGKYNSMIAAQKVKTITPPKPVGPKKVNGKLVKVTGEWMVYPHQVVTVFERVE